MGTVPSAVRGNSGIYITLKEKGGSGTAEEFDGNLKNVRIGSEDKDDLTFAEVAAGLTKDANLVLTAIQSLAVGSLWRLLWDNPGSEFDVVYGPQGNAVASADKPHFIGTVKADGRPEVGVEAKRTKERGEFEYTLEFVVGPELSPGI